ncbi:MAG: DUF4124 domain-containing protein [Syntrophales bacterium]
MKKKTLIILAILFMPLFAHAATYYRCVGKGGEVSITDYPLEGQTCKVVGTVKEKTAEERMKEKKESEAREKERAEEDKKRAADEETQMKAADALERCYAGARARYENCVPYKKAYMYTFDDYVANAARMRCEAKHQEEREKCLQEHLEKP